MNSYEEIKQFLAKKDFKSALLVAFSNNLKFKLTSKISNNQESLFLETTIDLLKGITTKVSDESILNNQSSLMKFHSSQLERIHDIWDDNRQILITILKVLANNDNNKIELNNLKTSLSAINSTSSKLENKPPTLEKNVDNIVDLMLEDNEDSVDETKDEEYENVMVTAEQQEIAQESWNEFMDDLSAEEAAVTEEVIVNETPSDEEIEDWSEWLGNEDLAQDDWQEEEITLERRRDNIR